MVGSSIIQKGEFMYRKIMIASASLSMLGACAPLQQAPLVYSSKNVVGVDVSATTNEAPGASINIGYKQVDAAYVPVAVAKPCDKNESDKIALNCQSDIYKLHLVRGSSEEGIEAKEGNNDNAESVEIVRNYQIRTVSHELAIKKRDEAEKQLAEIASQEQETDTSKQVGIQARKELATKELGAAKLAWQAAQNEFNQAKAKFDKLSPEQMKKANDATKKSNQVMQDAFSVFGSFDAKTQTGVGPQEDKETSADSQDKKPLDLKAGVNLGKMFSTGIAAQNLTKGLEAHYRNQSAAGCLERARHLTDDPHIKSDAKIYVQVLTEALKACQPDGTAVPSKVDAGKPDVAKPDAVKSRDAEK